MVRLAYIAEGERLTAAERSLAEMENGTYWPAVGHRMRLTRFALGITEKEAAAAWGVTLTTYRRYEAGAPQRSSGPTLRFSEVYDVSFDWVICGETARLKRRLTRGKVAILPRCCAFCAASTRTVGERHQ
jgi:DNA-binding XRE family transcriptional regulator